MPKKICKRCNKLFLAETKLQKICNNCFLHKSNKNSKKQNNNQK